MCVELALALGADAIVAAGRRLDGRDALAVEHLAAVPAHRVGQGLSQAADAAAHVGHPAPRHVERGRAVECVGRGRGRLCGDQELAVDIMLKRGRGTIQPGAHGAERI